MTEKNQDLWQKIQDKAKEKRRTVAIGINNVTPRIVESLKKAEEFVDVVVVGKEIEGFKSYKSDNPELLFQMAKDKKVDAIVRGNFDALDAYNAARKVLNHEGSILEIVLFKLNGVNTINENATGIFSGLPGSFVNERSLYDKIKSIDMHIEFYKKIGLEPKLGILGPGKMIDVLDNVPEVNQGLAEAQFLVNWYTEKGIWAKYFNHQIEYAVQEASIIVFPNSWAGNFAGHCMLYLGNVDFLGGAALNVKDIVYVDDSEAMQDFTNCLIFAGFLANNENK